MSSARPGRSPSDRVPFLVSYLASYTPYKLADDHGGRRQDVEVHHQGPRLLAEGRSPSRTSAPRATRTSSRSTRRVRGRPQAVLPRTGALRHLPRRQHALGRRPLPLQLSGHEHQRGPIAGHQRRRRRHLGQFLLEGLQGPAAPGLREVREPVGTGRIADHDRVRRAGRRPGLLPDRRPQQHVGHRALSPQQLGRPAALSRSGRPGRASSTRRRSRSRGDWPCSRTAWISSSIRRNAGR